MRESDDPKPHLNQTVDAVTARSYLRSLADALKSGKLSLLHDDTFLSLRHGTRVRFRLKARSDQGEETVHWETEGPPPDHFLEDEEEK